MPNGRSHKKSEKVEEPKVEVAVSTKLPEPGDKRPVVEEVKVDVTPTLAFNKDTILYSLYLQYKANMITRTNLKTYFQIINGKHPDNIAKYLVDEAAKG